LLASLTLWEVRLGGEDCLSDAAISAYRRRPLPATNLLFLSTVMWDGRETFKNPDGTFMPVAEDLAHQAVDATTGHAQGAAPSPEQVQQIVNFETQIFTAQTHDDDDEHAAARRAIARGQNLFNTLKIPITGVAGLNDVLHTDTIDGFCGTCHDSPNVGDHSVPAPLNIGLVDGSLRTSDLPLFTVMCNSTGVITQVTDIGRAMVTGKCADIGKFKGPILKRVGRSRAILSQWLRRDAYGRAQFL